VHEVGKAPIRPQIVESRFEFQRGQRPVTLTEGVVQPFKSRRDGTFYIVGIRLAGREPLFSGSRHGLWWLATICLAALTLLVVLLKPNSQ
jgi:hypothetical protein